MAGSNDIDFNLRLKGTEQAKQDLQGLAADVDKEAEKLNQKGQERQKQSAKSFGESFGDELEKSFSGKGIGKKFARALGPQAFSTLNTGIAQTFDPNLSAAEKELNAAKAGLSVLPYNLGAIPSAKLEAVTQEIIGAAHGTSARLNQMLGPAFQASSGLSAEDFAAKFGPIIDRFKAVIEDQERARERGSELIASRLGSFLGEFNQKKEDVLKDTPKDAASTSNKELIESNKLLAQSNRDLAAALARAEHLAGKTN